MATILNPKQNDPLAGPQTQNPILSGGGGVLGGGIGGPAQPQSPGASFQFPDVNAYLDANKDSAVQFAGTAGHNLAQNAEAPVNAEFNAFKSSVDAATPKDNPALVGQATNTPQSVANDPTLFSQWNSIYNANYGGPTAFTPSDNATKKINDVLGIKDIESALPYVYGDSQVNPGQRALDELIFGQTPGAYNALMGESQAQLPGYLAAQTKNAVDYAGAAKTAADAIKSGAAGAITGQANSLNQAYGANEAAYSNDATQMLNAMRALGFTGNGQPLSTFTPEYILAHNAQVQAANPGGGSQALANALRAQYNAALPFANTAVGLRTSFANANNPNATAYEKLANNPALFSWV